MKIVCSHPTGNANVRAVAHGFMEAGLLAEFYTTIAAFPGSALDQLGGIRAFSEIRRRRYEPELQPFTTGRPWLEAGRLVASRLGLSQLTHHGTGRFGIDAVYRNLDNYVATRLPQAQATAVYAYEDGAAASFRQAKQLDLQCLYDLPIGYWRAARRLLATEREQWPDWAATLVGFHDSEIKLARKDEELRLADRILVASQFTAKTLADFPGPLAPIEIIPYGFPATGSPRIYAPAGKRRLKLLFVGGLSQRKGIANLFAAVAGLTQHVELTVVGRKATDHCPALDAALARHCWIPSLPHAEILQLMRQHDVLVFPSLFEGFGLVITEAMSQGTPVITTDRTAGPDLIVPGANGWLVEAGATEALQQAIEHLLYHPAAIAAAGRAAVETARQRPWEVYGREVVAALTRRP